MIAFGQAVQDYLAIRRALGTKLRDHDWMLGDFVAYLEAAGAVTLTTELAVVWARLPGVDAHPGYLSSRLSVVRGFARHFQAFDPTADGRIGDPFLTGRKLRAARAIPTAATTTATMATTAFCLTITLPPRSSGICLVVRWRPSEGRLTARAKRHRRGAGGEARPAEGPATEPGGPADW